MPRSFTSLFQTDLESPDLQSMLSDIQMTMQEWQENIMRLVVRDVVMYLKAYTSRKNPPRYPRRKYTYVDDVRTKLTVKQQKELQPDRPAHPGGWSDVTGPDDPDSLYAGYYGRVDVLPGGGVKGTIGNRSSHAAFVEAKEGYFVVTGVFAPNGPVFKALKKYMRKYAPGTRVTNQLQGIEQVEGKPTAVVDTVVAS